MLSIVQQDLSLTVGNDVIIVNRVVVSTLSDFSLTRERPFDREKNLVIAGQINTLKLITCDLCGYHLQWPEYPANYDSDGCAFDTFEELNLCSGTRHTLFKEWRTFTQWKINWNTFYQLTALCPLA